MLSALAMSLALSIPSGPLHPMCFAQGEGFRAGGCHSRKGLSPRTILQVPSPLARSCAGESWAQQKTLSPPEKNLELLLMVFNWAARSQSN